MISVRAYILIYSTLMLVELIVLYLTKLEYLSLNYGWEARINMLQLASLIGVQIIVLTLTLRINKQVKKLQLLKAQSLAYIVSAIWIAKTVAIDYKYIS